MIKIKPTNKRCSTYTLNDSALIRLNELKRLTGISKSQIIEVILTLTNTQSIQKQILKVAKAKFKSDEPKFNSKVIKYKSLVNAKKKK